MTSPLSSRDGKRGWPSVTEFGRMPPISMANSVHRQRGFPGKHGDATIPSSILLIDRPLVAHSLRPAYGGFVRVFARPAGVGISGVRRIFYTKRRGSCPLAKSPPCPPTSLTGGDHSFDAHPGIDGHFVQWRVEGYRRYRPWSRSDLRVCQNQADPFASAWDPVAATASRL
jgi:hypothetical protein